MAPIKDTKLNRFRLVTSWNPSYHHVDGLSKAFHEDNLRLAALSPSPISPQTLSSAYPHHTPEERAMVSSLDRKTRHPSLISPTCSSAIDEESTGASARTNPSTQRLPPLELHRSSTSPAHCLPSPPLDHDLPAPMRSPASDRHQVSPLASPGRPRQDHAMASPPTATDETSAAPSCRTNKRPGLSLQSPNHARRRVSYGAGDGTLRHPDAFVIARSLKHQPQPAGGPANVCNNSGSGLGIGSPGRVCPNISMPSSRRLTVRAIVRSRASGRKPFLLQRTYDLDELSLAAISSADGPNDVVSGRGSLAKEPTALVSPGAVSPYHGDGERRRASSVASGMLLSGRCSPSDIDSLIGDGIALPIGKGHPAQAPSSVPI